MDFVLKGQNSLKRGHMSIKNDCENN